MGYLADEIESVASNIGIIILAINESKAFEIRSKLALNFTNDKQSPQRVSWQNLNMDYCTSVYDPDGWKLIKDYIKNEAIILFLSSSDEQKMWLFQSGNDLVSVLSESIGFPFCVTSSDADYILCFDDHNCLIGGGRNVKEWIVKLRKNSPFHSGSAIEGV